MNNFVLNNNFLLSYDEIWMRRALFLAKKSIFYNEVPVGAVLIFNNMELCSSFNFTFNSNNLLCHAEINVLTIISQKLDTYRLYNTILYVSLEPCIMCFGAILRSKISRVVFGAFSDNIYSMTKILNFNMVIDFNYIGGILDNDSKRLLDFFFKKKRNKSLMF